MGLTKKKFKSNHIGPGGKGCFCNNIVGHERQYYPGGHCHSGTAEPGWLKHGFQCSKGWHGINAITDSRFIEQYPHLQYAKETDVATEAADLYLLEAMAYDVANPRPFTVTDVDGFNFTQVARTDLLKLIGVKGPKTVQKFVEKHGEGVDTTAALMEQYEKWAGILAPNVPLDRSLKDLKTEAGELLTSQMTRLANIFRDYGHYSNCTELSYHRHYNTAFDGDVGHVTSAYGWSKLIDQVGGAEAARIAAGLFRDKTPGGKKAWDNAYGGGKWATAAEVLSYFEDGFMTKKSGKEGKPFSAKLFCDRMFSLQHNTGSILTKVQWNFKGRGTLAGYGINYMVPLLDAHHNSDWYRLQTACSLEVLEMFQTYWTVTNRELVRAGLEPVKYPFTSPAYLHGTNKPDTVAVAERPEPSNKAFVVVMGSEANHPIPDKLAKVGKKVVYQY